MPFLVTVAVVGVRGIRAWVGVWVSEFGVRSIVKRETEKGGGGGPLYNGEVTPYTGVT